MDKKTWGTKRTCANCAARFYDLNRGSGVCPKCDAPFDSQATTKRKRVRAVAVEAAASEAKKPEAKVEAPETPQPALDPVKDTETVAEIAANGDGAAADSLEKIDAIDESDDEDDSLIEDASELGEDDDDVADVIGKVKDLEGRT
ncbi:MAG: TIGR02300 family protein [Alphaproteobacteria bacterium]